MPLNAAYTARAITDTHRCCFNRSSVNTFDVDRNLIPVLSQVRKLPPESPRDRPRGDGALRAGAGLGAVGTDSGRWSSDALGVRPVQGLTVITSERPQMHVSDRENVCNKVCGCKPWGRVDTSWLRDVASDAESAPGLSGPLGSVTAGLASQ